MLFSIKKTVRVGTLKIRLTFEQSDEPPCEEMLDHANEVCEWVRDRFDESESNPPFVAFTIFDRFRRVSSVYVVDRNGNGITCSGEDES